MADITLLPVRLPPGVEATPAEVLQMLKCGCSTNGPCSTAPCGCATSQITCTVFCKCYLNENCQNPLTKRADALEREDDDEEEPDSTSTT